MMASDTAQDRVKRELQRTLEHMRADLDRIEILTAALNAFSRPIPDYEPAFRHLRQMPLSEHELASRANGES